MKKKNITAAVLMAVLLGCTAVNASENKPVYDGKGILNPENPVYLTIWHYYNGAHQAAFDKLVEEFNNTVGKELGIYVENYSKGSVADLEAAISDSVSGVIGAEEMPDLFSSYTDTAYELQKDGILADLRKYFTQEELDQYVDSYIHEGEFANDGGLYVFPTAKSTEITMMNKTDWEPFAEAVGVSLEDLSTIQGIVKVAEQYYNWTDAQTPDIPDDGKAFYGRDSMSNYFLIGMKQLGYNLVDVSDGKASVQADKEALHTLWDNYYVPYVKGYFVSYGKFGSDDVKTGDTLAYTGSTASSMYFPDSVEPEDDSYPIEYVICNAPVMEGGEAICVQQGAGMAVTAADEMHEYAASVFLRWFTENENNLKFGAASGYLPVRKEANKSETLDRVIKEAEIQIAPKTYDCLTKVMDQFEDTEYYIPPCFEGSYPVRKVLDYNLKDKAIADRALIDAQVKDGTGREEAAAAYITEEAFENWYEEFVSALTEVIGTGE